MVTADDIIQLLDLKPLPLEGGFFRETHRSADIIPADTLSYTTDKSAATAIYYLLATDSFSALHRLPTDEVYHFYLGDPVELLQLGPAGGKVVTLGSDLLAAQQPQWVVPRGLWHGSRLLPGGRVALLGTTMAPGFDFSDYEHGDRAELIAQFPDFRSRIERLTRE